MLDSGPAVPPTGVSTTSARSPATRRRSRDRCTRSPARSRRFAAATRRSSSARGTCARTRRSWDASLNAALVLAAPGDVRDRFTCHQAARDGSHRSDDGHRLRLVSLELLAPEERRAGRMRVGLPPRSSGADRALGSAASIRRWTGRSTELSTASDSALATDAVPIRRNVGVF